MIENKKGQFQIFGFFLLLITIVVVGFIAVLFVAITSYGNSIINPIFTNLGVVGSANLSQAGQATFGVVNTFIGAVPWLVAFAYVAMLIFSVVFVVGYGNNPSPIWIGVYMMFVVFLIFFCIIMSNMYQDIYSGTDVIAQGLQSQVAMSYMILYSPIIMTIISLIVGVYMFAGREAIGGYGV